MNRVQPYKVLNVFLPLFLQKKQTLPWFLSATHRRASVSVLFAVSVTPLLVVTALGIDTAFYIEAQAQMQLSADAAAMNAVRTAAADLLNGETPAQAIAAATTAGQQWFDAQLGNLASANNVQRSVSLSFNTTSNTFTALISYSATIPTHLGRIINIASWPLSGASTAVMTTLSYVEVLMLIDNSPSMLIGATDADIVAIEQLTLCAPTATANNNTDQPLQASYAWNFPSGIGYATSNGKATDTLPTSTAVGSCDSNFDGPSDQCFYPINPSTTNIQANGLCKNNNGVYSSAYNGNIPLAPCAFACHTATSNDYYALVRAASPAITLRFDVIQQAAHDVISTMQSKAQAANQFSIGVFEFNAAVTEIHPASASFVESDTNLTQAATDVSNITTPIVSNSPNTNFAGAASYLAQNLTAAGTGLSPSSPRKNLFIITDGMEDATVNGTRVTGEMTDPTNETECAPIKALGYTIYVLYTPYTPLANPYYLAVTKSSVESSSGDPPVVQALKACASIGTNGLPLYYEASSQTDINSAMQTMLASALNTPGRLAN